MWRSATPLVSTLVFTNLIFTSLQTQILALQDEALTYSEANCKITCPQTRHRPVCGSDGRTYVSRCELQRQVQCEGNEIYMKHRGMCTVPLLSADLSEKTPISANYKNQSKEESKCMAERDHRSTRPKPSAFIPECLENGSYAQVQCHGPTRYCWCVNENGLPVPGSSVMNKRPNCNGNDAKKQNSKRTTEKTRIIKGCNQDQKKEFNTALIKIFLFEYNQLTTTSPDLTKSTVPFGSEEKKAADWKFTELDQNGDSGLDKKELRVLRRLLKKLVRPKTCARSFIRTCDQNQDKRISRYEWTSCLGVMNNEQFEPTRDDSSSSEKVPSRRTKFTTLPDLAQPTDFSTKTTEDDFTDCVSVRQLALEDLKHTEGKVFVPDCSPDGKYRKMQCFNLTSYCWCVDPDTGKTIVGSTLVDAKPDCNKPFGLNKPIKGCKTERKKQQFLAELLESLVEEMVTLNHSNLDQKPDISTNTLEIKEKAALQKLHLLDANNNNVIDKKEWKHFKNEIRKRKVIKKCGRNFLKYCDGDNDKKVTEDEWISCLGLRDRRIIKPFKRPPETNPSNILND